MNRRIVLALGVVAFGALVATLVSMGPNSNAEPAVVDDGAARFHVGRTDVWTVDWTTSATADLPIGDQPAFDVSSALTGTWAVTTVSVTDSVVTQRAALREVDALVVLASGEPVDVSSEVLTDVPVTLTRRPNGELLTVVMPPDAASAARNTLAGLSRLFSVSPTDGERYATYGVAQDEWRGNQRHTSRFASLTGVPVDAAVSGRGMANARFGDGGRLLVLSAHDEAAATREGRTLLNTVDTVSFLWSGVDSSPVVAPVETVWSSAPPRVEQSVWESRAEGYSTQRVLAEVTGYEGGDAAALMWGGTARLAVDARARESVARVASQPGTSHQSRELALDLLAHTPNALAEAELIDALQSDAVLSADVAGAYVQRLSFVDAPSARSVRLLHDLVASSDPQLARAARHALGAVARKSPDVDAAMTPLRGPLPSDADDAASVIAGLGNAAQSTDVAVLVASASDSRAKVRASAIHGLRHFGDAIAIPVVRDAVDDEHPGVQRAALTAVGQRGFDGVVLERVAHSASEGRIDGANLGVLATALAPHTDNPHARTALRLAMAHQTADPTFRARVRAMLAQ